MFPGMLNYGSYTVYSSTLCLKEFVFVGIFGSYSCIRCMEAAILCNMYLDINTLTLTRSHCKFIYIYYTVYNISDIMCIYIYTHIFVMYLSKKGSIV